MTNSKHLLLAFATIMTFTGCATPKDSRLYHWGSYEQQIYAMYNDPGKVPPEQQLLQLEADFEKARAANKPVPPGYNAQIGYLCFQLGKIDQALNAFETEKTLFPESTIYIDRLIARIKP